MMISIKSFTGPYSFEIERDITVKEFKALVRKRLGFNDSEEIQLFHSHIQDVQDDDLIRVTPKEGKFTPLPYIWDKTNYTYSTAEFFVYVRNYRNSSKEVALTRVKENGLNLFYENRNMNNDKTVVLTAVRQNAAAFKFASKELRRNRAIVYEASTQKYVRFYMYVTDKNLIPFLEANHALHNALNKNKIAAIQQITKRLIGESKSLFLDDRISKEDLQTLSNVLNETSMLLNDEISPSDYKTNLSEYKISAQHIAVSESPVIKRIGNLLLALAAVVASLSIGLACTGGGALPAAGAGLLAAGFFAGGMVLKNKKSPESVSVLSEKDAEISELMSELKSACYK